MSGKSPERVYVVRVKSECCRTVGSSVVTETTATSAWGLQVAAYTAQRAHIPHAHQLAQFYSHTHKLTLTLFIFSQDGQLFTTGVVTYRHKAEYQ